MPNYASLAEQYGGKVLEDPKQPVKLTGTVNYASLAEQYGGKTVTQTPKQSEQKGFFRTLGEDIVRPFAELGVSAYGAAKATGNLMAGDVAGASAELDKTRKVPFVGESRPAFTGQETVGEFAKKVGGYGLEVGSYLPFSFGVKKVADLTFKGAIKQGLKTGAKEGILGGTMVGAARPLEETKKADEIIWGVVTGGITGGVLGGTLGTLLPVPSAVYGKIKFAVAPTIKQLNERLPGMLEKGIRPGVKKTYEQMSRYYNRASEAVKTIVENKKNLVFTDDAGQPITRLPESLKEFSKAIQDTKKTIFKIYDGLAKVTGDMGAKVNLNPIADELDKAISSKVLQDLHPEIVAYAKNRSDTLRARGAYSPHETQEAIQTLNQSLDAFYSNPSFESASKVIIDAGVANNFRKELDKTIESLTGKDYQLLKNKYGALKEIEKDVIRRTMVEARKATKGLIDYTDIFSGGQIVNGILSLNPALIAQGFTQKAISAAFKRLNDPNRTIRRMFQEVDRVLEKNKPAPKIKQSLLLLPPGRAPLPERSVVELPGKGILEGQKNIQPQPSVLGKSGIIKNPVSLDVTDINARNWRTTQGGKNQGRPSIQQKLRGYEPGKDSVAGAALGGMEPEYDENGRIKGFKFNPERAMVGAMAGLLAGKTAKGFNKSTGIFSGVEGKARFEIIDRGMNIKPLKSWWKGAFEGKTTKLSDVIEHKELFKQYPEFKNIKISIKENEGLDWGEAETLLDKNFKVKEIVLNNKLLTDRNFNFKDDAKSKEFLSRKILHELQHAIQVKEGFLTGGSPGEKLGFSQYRNLPGEQESRLVERRFGLSDKALEKGVPKKFREPLKLAGFAPKTDSMKSKSGLSKESSLTTKFLEYAKGKTTLSRQEIMDFARRPELKKGEADLLLKKLEEFSSDYRYHETSVENLQKIQTQGLKPAEGQFGKGVYFSPKIGKGEASGRGLLLRSKKGNLDKLGYDEFKDVSSGKIDEGWTEKSVNPKDLEYSKDGGKTWFDISGKKTDSKLPAQEFTDSIRRDLLLKKLEEFGQNAEPLTQEARKYKTAEEFVGGYTQKIFRGGGKFDIKAVTEEGVSVTYDKGIAKKFSENIEELFIPDNARILQWEQIPNKENLFRNVPGKGLMPIEKNVGDFDVELGKIVKSMGYDGVDLRELGFGFEKEYRIYNPDILKTKSQLTDIWKKAHGKMKDRDIVPFLDKLRQEKKK